MIKKTINSTNEILKSLLKNFLILVFNCIPLPNTDSYTDFLSAANANENKDHTRATSETTNKCDNVVFDKTIIKIV